jgi:hypothetical protein
MNHGSPTQYSGPAWNVMKDTIIKVVLLAKSKPTTLVVDSFGIMIIIHNCPSLELEISSCADEGPCSFPTDITNPM